MAVAPESRFLAALVSPDEYESEIPDTEARAVVKTSSAINGKFSPADKTVDEYVVFQPKYYGAGLVWRGAAVPRYTYPGTSVNPGSNVAVIAPVALLPLSRKLSQSYTYGRASAGVLHVYSAAVSTGNAALTGTFTGAFVADLRDITTVSPSGLVQTGVTSMDSASQVPSFDGVRLVTGPEVVQPLQALETTVSHESQVSVLPFASTTTTGTSCEFFAPNYATMTCGTFSAVVKLTALGQCTIAAGWARAQYNAPYGLVVQYVDIGSQLFTANQLATVSGSFAPPSDGNLYQLHSIRVTSGATGTVISNPILTLYGYEDGQNHHWAGVVCCSGFNIDQPINLAGKINYEAIPGQALAVDYKPDARNWSIMRMEDLSIAASMFNSRDSPLKRIWRISEWKSFLEQGLVSPLVRLYSMQPLLSSAMTSGNLLSGVSGTPRPAIASDNPAATDTELQLSQASPIGDLLTSVAKSFLPAPLVDVAHTLVGSLIPALAAPAPGRRFGATNFAAPYTCAPALVAAPALTNLGVAAPSRGGKRLKLCAPVDDFEPRHPNQTGLAAPAQIAKLHAGFEFELTTAEKTYQVKDCLDPSDVINAAETGWYSNLKALMQNKPKRPDMCAAKIATVVEDGQKHSTSVEYITTTKQQVFSVTHNGSPAATTYRTFIVTNGDREFKNRVSKDLYEAYLDESSEQNTELGRMCLAQIAITVVLAELDDMFITGPSTGTIGGDSFGMALYLSIFGVCPSQAVISGGMARAKRADFGGFKLAPAGKLMQKYRGITKYYENVALVCHPQRDDPLISAYLKQPASERAGIVTALSLQCGDSAKEASCFLVSSMSDVFLALSTIATRTLGPDRSADEEQFVKQKGEAKAQAVAEMMSKYQAMPPKQRAKRLFPVTAKQGTLQVPLFDMLWWSDHADGANKANITREMVKRHITMGNAARLEGMAMAVLNNTGMKKSKAKNRLKYAGDSDEEVAEPAKTFKPKAKKSKAKGTPFQRAFTQQPTAASDSSEAEEEAEEESNAGDWMAATTEEEDSSAEDMPRPKPGHKYTPAPKPRYVPKQQAHLSTKGKPALKQKGKPNMVRF